MNLFQVSGTFNARPIKTKIFKDSNKALKYLDRVLVDCNVEVNDVINVEDTLTTYVVNNYTRFTVAKLD